MQTTPKSLRIHIALCGRRNVGKSSLLNALTHQHVSIVSPVAGTTTDPVEKPMELQPIGPVVFIDTAGVDDVGALGAARVERTRKALERSDIAILVAEAGEWGPYEQELLDELRARKLPTLVVFNKIDLGAPSPAIMSMLQAAGVPVVGAAAHSGEGVDEAREALLALVPESLLREPTIAGDLVPPGEIAVLVVPIDLEAPKGRLILAQVQVIRDLLDSDAGCLVVKEHQLRAALASLSKPPALVVTDSQAFAQVAAETPPDVPLTSFSILFARYKGDLEAFVAGARAIDTLRPGDPVLIAEACTHHPIGDDIGHVKIPRWLAQHAGGPLDLTHVRGRDFPSDLSRFKLVIHCGACVWNRREMLSRVEQCRKAGVPITNYGMAIAHTLGIIERALAPFGLSPESQLV